MSLNNEDFNTLDPRGFSVGNANLWVINSKNPKAPLMRGNILIPVRLLDFMEQYSEKVVLNGSFFHKLNICFWENDTQTYYYKTTPNAPQYNGDVELYTPGLDPDLREAYEQAIKIRKAGRQRKKRTF